VGRRGFPLSVQCRGTLRALILQLDVVDTADNEEGVTAVRTLVFVFHFTITTAEGNGAEFF
jgi:hypothetical protein